MGLWKRPREELYDLRADPYQTKNVAADSEYAEHRAKLDARLMKVLNETGDPRVIDNGQFFESPPMAGPIPDDAKGAPRQGTKNAAGKNAKQKAGDQ